MMWTIPSLNSLITLVEIPCSSNLSIRRSVVCRLPLDRRHVLVGCFGLVLTCDSPLLRIATSLSQDHARRGF